MPGLDPPAGRSPFGEAKARASIEPKNAFPKKMDGRVKPGHDAWSITASS
jgi:hypothetical protein